MEKNADCSIYASIFNWVCYAMQWIKIDPSKILMNFSIRFLLYYFPANEVFVVNFTTTNIIFYSPLQLPEDDKIFLNE